MSSFVALDHFSNTTLTAIPTEDKPTYNSLKIIHQELNANAMAIPSTLGGGHYGHLGLVLTAIQYNDLPNTIPWTNPVHPGPAPVHGAAPTGPQITENNRVFAAAETKFLIFKATEQALKKQLIEAVPDTFIKTLKHEMYGYAQVTVLTLLTHLDRTYGTVGPDDLRANMKRMTAEWSPIQPIEDLYNQVKDAQKFAADHDPITDKHAVRAAIDNLTDSGVFTDALRDWRKKEIENQEFTDLEAHFTAADKERRRILTTKEMGYANKTVEKGNSKATPHTNVGGRIMYYCWSHGLGTNDQHTSMTCSKKQEGHRTDATADNMQGGCCVIHRRAGEKPIYRRAKRDRMNHDNNDENQPPAART
ncbi:hypothetical protein SEMRO_3585_G349380.1 [Seminavis robusta]|uniref:Uncharacterized protein n=1 Tax=Seminavis robusta TaxID=568900 RepID=A0A9N8HZF4_9STRA|nr:hypothetical protein SEMRO_3585_G349380.1 [Seminavis robusta]|eukprot:Sro3585_g349380.1 n/a (362) ;mRNA; r:4600-5685